MGQKINPVGLRLGVNRTWDSRWFAGGADYARLLHQDLKLRTWLKERLVAACRAFALQGFDYGFAGHLTVRDPEFPDLYWTNPMCVHFSQVKVSNLILADHEGKVVEGQYAINRAGFVLHAAVHEAHPDIVAMCHAHTTYGTAFAALGKPLDPISQDAAAFYEDHVVIKSEAGQVAVEKKAGPKVADWFKGVKAAIHQNHGLLTASRHSIESAAFWFIALERCCQQQLMVEATGSKPEAEKPAKAAKPAAQSHIHQARNSAQPKKLPETGPMAEMLKRMFGKKD